jgi:putative ABC transport system permease protein
MTRHLIKLVWNRKRRNGLLLVEIVCAFLVLAGVVILALHTLRNTREPVGFNRADLWELEVGTPPSADADAQAVSDQPIMLGIMNELRRMGPVRSVAGGFTGPYINSQWGSRLVLADGRRMRYSVNRVTDDYRDALQLRLVEGRWFTREDDVRAWDAVVLNQRLAREIFGDVSPVGRTIEEAPEERRNPGDPPRVPKRVIGVIEEFRQLGELATPENFLFYRMHVDRSGAGQTPIKADQLPGHLFLRLAPGTTAAFEEPLLRRLATLAPTWSFTVEPADRARTRTNQAFLIPIGALAVVALSLLVMVALGLTGVLWQSVTQRTREFGLRRAAGATAAAVQSQVLAELLLLGTLAVLIGIAIVWQLTLLPRPADFPEIQRSTLLLGVAASVTTIYGVMLLCGWYPSRLATRVPPAEALHYE